MNTAESRLASEAEYGYAVSLRQAQVELLERPPHTRGADECARSVPEHGLIDLSLFRLPGLHPLYHFVTEIPEIFGGFVRTMSSSSTTRIVFNLLAPGSVTLTRGNPAGNVKFPSQQVLDCGHQSVGIIRLYKTRIGYIGGI
jgi:hypothetical protein